MPLLYQDPEIAGLSNRNLYSPGAPHCALLRVAGSGVPPSAQPNILLQTYADCRMDTRPESDPDPVPGTHRHHRRHHPCSGGGQCAWRACRRAPLSGCLAIPASRLPVTVTVTAALPLALPLLYATPAIVRHDRSLTASGTDPLCWGPFHLTGAQLPPSTRSHHPQTLFACTRSVQRRGSTMTALRDIATRPILSLTARS